jgi:hypothetical protein
MARCSSNSCSLSPTCASPQKWRSVAAAASYFGLKSPKTLYSLVARHQLPPRAVLRIGKQLRINVEAIEAAAVRNPLSRRDPDSGGPEPVSPRRDHAIS